MANLSIVPCSTYTSEAARAALIAALEPLGGLDWVRPGMRIGIKVNLLRMAGPNSAVITHPVLVTALCELLTERGALPIVGDSPAGPWNGPFLSSIYRTAGLQQALPTGAQLNYDFSVREVRNAHGKVLQQFPCTAWLDEVDAVINFAKLKTHALTTMTAAVKNLFGIIPGTRKVELHCRFPDVTDFAQMLIDLNESLRPCLVLVDAVDAMEGNGPSSGTPRHLGALVASTSPYAADLLCAHLIGLTPAEVPTLQAAISRKLCPASVSELQIAGDPAAFAVRDFQNLPPQRSAFFSSSPRLIQALAKRCFDTHPRVHAKQCTGCGACVRACPAEAIAVAERTAQIDRTRCIRCFCCQELCPAGAITVHRTALAHLLTK